MAAQTTTKATQLIEALNSTGALSIFTPAFNRYYEESKKQLNACFGNIRSIKETESARCEVTRDIMSESLGITSKTFEKNLKVFAMNGTWSVGFLTTHRKRIPIVTISSVLHACLLVYKHVNLEEIQYVWADVDNTDLIAAFQVFLVQEQLAFEASELGISYDFDSWLGRNTDMPNKKIGIKFPSDPYDALRYHDNFELFFRAKNETLFGAIEKMLAYRLNMEKVDVEDKKNDKQTEKLVRKVGELENAEKVIAIENNISLLETVAEGSNDQEVIADLKKAKEENALQMEGEAEENEDCVEVSEQEVSLGILNKVLACVEEGKSGLLNRKVSLPVRRYKKRSQKPRKKRSQRAKVSDSEVSDSDSDTQSSAEESDDAESEESDDEKSEAEEANVPDHISLHDIFTPPSSPSKQKRTYDTPESASAKKAKKSGNDENVAPPN